MENAESFTVPFTVTGGTFGEDYTIAGQTSSSGTISIPPGTTGTAASEIRLTPIGDQILEDDVVLTISLGEPSNGISTGYPLAASYTLTIANDDCEYVEAEFIGEAGAREFYSNGSQYPVASSPDYVVNFVSLGNNVLQMDNFWDSGWIVNININPATSTVTVPLQDIPGGWHVEGSGSLNSCTNELLISTRIYNDDGTYDDTNDNRYRF